VPPEKGHSDVSFWYATYCVVGLGVLLLCSAYYYAWIVILPKLFGYEIVIKVEESKDGTCNTRLVKKYNRSLAQTGSDQEPLLNSTTSGLRTGGLSLSLPR